MFVWFDLIWLAKPKLFVRENCLVLWLRFWHCLFVLFVEIKINKCTWHHHQTLYIGSFVLFFTKPNQSIINQIKKKKLFNSWQPIGKFNNVFFFVVQFDDVNMIIFFSEFCFSLILIKKIFLLFSLRLQIAHPNKANKNKYSFLWSGSIISIVSSSIDQSIDWLIVFGAKTNATMMMIMKN